MKHCCTCGWPAPRAVCAMNDDAALLVIQEQRPPNDDESLKSITVMLQCPICGAGHAYSTGIAHQAQLAAVAADEIDEAAAN